MDFDLKSSVPVEESPDGQMVTTLVPFDIKSSVPETLSIPDMYTAKHTNTIEQLGGILGSHALNMRQKWDESLKTLFPEDSTQAIARAQNVYLINKATGKSLLDIENNYDQIVMSPEMSKISGMKRDPTLIEALAAPMGAGIIAGVASNPVTTIGGLAIFTALDKMLPIKEWVPTGVGDEFKNTIEAVDLIGKVFLTHKIFTKAPGILETFTRQKLVDYKLPTVVNLSSAQVKDIYQTGLLTTPEQQSLFGALGLTGKELRVSVSQGISIQVSAEKLVTLTDKPIWAKVKSIFGIDPFAETRISYPERPTAGVSGLLPGPQEPYITIPTITSKEEAVVIGKENQGNIQVIGDLNTLAEQGTPFAAEALAEASKPLLLEDKSVPIEPKTNVLEYDKAKVKTLTDKANEIDKTLTLLERTRTNLNKKKLNTTRIDNAIEKLQTEYNSIDSQIADLMTTEKKPYSYRAITAQDLVDKELRGTIPDEEIKGKIQKGLITDINKVKKEVYQATGKHLQITSGLRSIEKQGELRMTLAEAAEPSKSKHVTGEALDIAFMEDKDIQAKWKAEGSEVQLKGKDKFLTGKEAKVIKSILKKNGFTIKDYTTTGHLHVEKPLPVKKPSFGEAWSPAQRKEVYSLAQEKGLIYKDMSGKTHNKLPGLLRHYKDASFDEIKLYISELTGERDSPPQIFKLYGDATKDAAAMKIIAEESKTWRDINTLELKGSLDVMRICEKVTGKDTWNENILSDNTFNTIASADNALFDRMVQENLALEQNIKDVLPGSKESAELMRKFEAKEELTPKEQKDVDYLRKEYDKLIAEDNDMRARLGKKPIPYRKDYMTHIRERNLLEDFFKGNEKDMSKISQEQLNAIRKGDYTKGNMPFNQFAQKRLGKETKLDAIGNFLIYRNTILREVYMTPAITHSRKFIEYALIKQINAYKAIDRWLNDIKGKPSIIDEGLLGVISSNKFVVWYRGAVAKSALLGNINFWLTNTSNFATGYGELGSYVQKGMSKFLGNKEWRQFAFKNSIVLKGRGADPDLIEMSKWNKLEQVVGGITNLIEYNNVGSTFLGAYFKGIEQLGYSNEKAILYADTIARRTQTGYKKYELPGWMRSNTGRLFSQFQTWAFNAMNHLIYDIGLGKVRKPSKVRWGAFLKLMTAVILTNFVYDKLGLNPPFRTSSVMPKLPGTPMRPRYEQTAPEKLITNVITALTGKKADTKKKAAAKAVSSFIPGGTQLERLLVEGKVLPSGGRASTGKVKRQ